MLATPALGSLETRKRRVAAQRYTLVALRVNSELYSVGCTIALFEMSAEHFILGIGRRIGPDCPRRVPTNPAIQSAAWSG